MSMRWLVVALLLGVVGLASCGQTVKVANEEVGPRALRDKYEWFKRASAALDKKRADVEVYDNRLSGMKADYAGAGRATWSREDREQYNIWRSEVAGIRASYNTLASQYNAEMAMFYTRFLNAGMMPEGARDNPPREYRAYDYDEQGG